MMTIKINGKEYPCRVTMGAMLRFKRETGKDVSQIGKGNVADLVTFLWCCTASASKADGVEFGMGLVDFADLLEPDTLPHPDGNGSGVHRHVGGRLLPMYPT